MADAADPVSGNVQANYRITGDAGTQGGMLRASVRLLGARDDRILWSSEFARPVAESDGLRQQIASRVADVLTCALASPRGKDEALSLETLRIYFAGCELRHTNWAAATTYFRQVTQRSPTFSMAWSYYAVTAAQMANDQPAAEAPAIREEARRIAQRALALDPHSAEPYFALVLTAPYMNQWKERYGYVAKGLALDPDNPELLTNRFFGLWASGWLHEAAPVARRASERSPSRRSIQRTWLSSSHTRIKSAQRAWSLRKPASDGHTSLSPRPVVSRSRLGLAIRQRLSRS